jgi:1-acyl-sn-glycerol-3-phosphate acyltransferase
VETSGLDRIRAVVRSRGNEGLLILPNHPTHADPPIMFEALRQAGLTSKFMVAYELFLRGKMMSRCIQWFGGFSVDREGSDLQATSEAMATISEGKHALTIFPEGNVYLQNDLITPLHDGAVFLGLKTALEKSKRVWAVPVSLKVTLLADVREARMERLRTMATDLKTPVTAAMAPLEQLNAVGMAALRRNLQHRGYELREGDGLPEVIRHAVSDVLSGLESKMGIASRPADTPIDRVRRARRAIHSIRIDPARAVDHKTAAAWADEAMIAFKIASYLGNYVASRPTLDRFSETVEKLDEDIYSRMPDAYAPRHAFVRFGTPIDLSSFVEDAKKKLRTTVESITEKCERSIQEGLDSLNSENPYPGGKLLDGPGS